MQQFDNQIINKKISESKIALETDFHLSYPFIIEDNNELYMIPERMR